MAEGTFATAINCMDGRVQLPVIEWMKGRFHVDYIDMITEPGPDKILAENITPLVESIKNRVAISVEKHGSKVVVIVGHADCAGNPVPKEKHIEHVKLAMALVKSWNLPISICGIWMETDWKPEIVDVID
ncbi:MAG: hypothetical protein KAR42_16290 [candidate division Zixibacteria bacterium]|nr:hypothetical protein [candidate division Zixibacteria bacterium]